MTHQQLAEVTILHMFGVLFMGTSIIGMVIYYFSNPMHGALHSWDSNVIAALLGLILWKGHLAWIPVMGYPQWAMGIGNYSWLMGILGFCFIKFLYRKVDKFHNMELG